MTVFSQLMPRQNAFLLNRYISSGVLITGINTCMEKNTPKQTDKFEQKSVHEIICGLNDETIHKMGRLELIRLLANTNQQDDVNSKAQEMLIGNFMSYADKLQFFLTLQTRVVPSRDSIKRDMQRADVAEDARHFWRRVNYKLWRVAAKRFPEKCSLMTLSFLEGGMFAPDGFRTFHFHVGVGKVPSSVGLLEFTKLICSEWAKTRYGTNDIDLKPASTGMLNYVTKEMMRGNWDCFDPINTAIPHLAPLA
jgi:hypothetical protein